jgi:hypothetical protein
MIVFVVNIALLAKTHRLEFLDCVVSQHAILLTQGKTKIVLMTTYNNNRN